MVKGRTHRQLSLHLMILPAAVLLVIYQYIPMLGLVISFQDYKPALGFTASPFVGLENFRYLFSNPNFARAMLNTVIIAFLKIVTGLVVPLTFSLMLNEISKSWYKRICQTLVYMPYFVSWVLMAGIIIDIFSPTGGIVNKFLGFFGVDPIFFVGDNKWFRFTLILTNVWKDFGWGTIIYMASLSGIDPCQYEAAMIDGAGRLKQTWHVTLPGLLPTIVLLATLSLGNVLNAGFDQVYNLASPVTMKSGDIIDTLVYRIGIENAQFSLATAAGLFKSAISCLLIVMSYKMADRFAGYRIF